MKQTRKELLKKHNCPSIPVILFFSFLVLCCGWIFGQAILTINQMTIGSDFVYGIFKLIVSLLMSIALVLGIWVLFLLIKHRFKKIGLVNKEYAETRAKEYKKKKIILLQDHLG